MQDLMIDIETLGTAPGSVILSIGAIEFDAETGDMGNEFYVSIDPQNCVENGMTMDVSTIKWWMDQSEEARREAFSGTETIRKALYDFSDFVKNAGALRVWAKPPSFDHVLMEAAYRILKIDIPWHYKTPRDCRTLFDLTNTIQPNVGTAHNALDDAKSQAAGVIDAYKSFAKGIQE